MPEYKKHAEATADETDKGKQSSNEHAEATADETDKGKSDAPPTDLPFTTLLYITSPGKIKRYGWRAASLTATLEGFRGRHAR
eukprot:scaffold29969_cov53-Phaeocystis_antarctica.AAC.3